MSKRVRTIPAAVLSALTLSLTASASPAGAATEIGHTFAPNPCSELTGTVFLQSTSPGDLYAAPFDGVVTSWSYQAAASPPALLKLKVGRSASANNFTIVGESAIQAPVPNQLNSYPTRIAVRAGDVIGPYYTSDGDCGRGTPGYGFHYHIGDLVPGSTATFTPETLTEFDLSAILEPDADGDGFGDETQDRCPGQAGPNNGCPPGTSPPPDGTPPPDDGLPSNDFSFGKVKKNKKKGTAKLTVKVPGPGELELAKTKKVKADEERADFPQGEIPDVYGENLPTRKEKLSIKPRGKAKKKLNRKGKAKVRAKVTFTPDGGEANTKSKKLRLRKR